MNAKSSTLGGWTTLVTVYIVAFHSDSRTTQCVARKKNAHKWMVAEVVIFASGALFLPPHDRIDTPWIRYLVLHTWFFVICVMLSARGGIHSALQEEPAVFLEFLGFLR